MTGQNEAPSQNPSPSGHIIEMAGKPSLDAIEDVASADNRMLDEATNKRILRKIDYKLMPVVRQSCFPNRASMD